MKLLISILVFGLSVSAIAAETTGYRIVHPDGTVEFTDDATRGGEEIKLRDVQTVQQSMDGDDEEEEEGNPVDRSSRKKPQDRTQAYISISITSPQPEQIIRAESGPVRVSVAVKPKLHPKDSVVIKLDGAESTRGHSTNLTLGQIYRGTHTVEASVVNENGTTVLNSSPVTFHFRQRGK